jgi:integrase
MPPTVQAMVQIQGMLAMRPDEICQITVGSIDRSKGNGLWYYTPLRHKTENVIGKKPLPLGKPEQELLTPYLINKKPGDAVFSPITAMQERSAEKRANRKTKVQPTQIARDEAAGSGAKKKFYTKDSYYNAVQYAIKKGRKHGVDIPHWFPKLLRNFGATYIEETVADDGLGAAQAQLGHTSADMTRRYSKAQLKKREELARNRVNPFKKKEDEDGGVSRDTPDYV